MVKKAAYVLKENVRALMVQRHTRQQDLADWCGHGKSWLNKWLNGDREIQFKDLDRMADYFGMLPHELFTPGISSSTERRSGVNRRRLADRRTRQDNQAANPRLNHEPAPLPRRPEITPEILELARAQLEKILSTAAGTPPPATGQHAASPDAARPGTSRRARDSRR